MQKVALITGAARRLGAQIADTLHAHGFGVSLHYQHSGAEADALAATLNARRSASAVAVRADLGDPDAPAQLLAGVRARWGRLDVLVNNAAVFRATPLAATSDADWTEIMGVNLKAPYFLSRAAAPLLAQNLGSIVNLADIYADRPKPDFAVYCAAKAGLIGLTKAFARDLAPAVRVNAVSPGAILWTDDDDLDTQRAVLAKTPLARRGEPQDIADAILYLANAAYVTGQIIAVDGGRSLFD